MATVICVTTGLPSVVYSSVELARRLAAAGHRVIYAGLEGERELAERYELEFTPLEPSRYERFLERDAGGMLGRLFRLRRRRQKAREALAVDGFPGALRDLDPDLVLINGEMHEQIIAAAGAGLPVALLNSFVSIWRRPGLPPPHCLVRPGVGWRGSRSGIALLWMALRLRKWRKSWVQRLRRVGCDRLSVLRSLARDVGFDLDRETDAGQWLIPFTYRRFPVLSLHAEEFEFSHRVPQKVSYVGPMVLGRRADWSMPDRENARLEAILARSRRAGGPRTLVYAAFGSVFTGDLELLRRLLGVVAERPEWDLVISLSRKISPADLGRLPDGAHVFAWVPQPLVLEHADAMVTHGGIGTIDECVMNGVPVLVYCGFETDMAGTTARVVHHGLGIAGDRRDDTAKIRQRINRLLGEPRFRENVARMRSRFEAYGERGAVERAVEALLEAGQKASDATSGRLGDSL